MARVLDKISVCSSFQLKKIAKKSNPHHADDFSNKIGGKSKKKNKGKNKGKMSSFISARLILKYASLRKYVNMF